MRRANPQGRLDSTPRVLVASRQQQDRWQNAIWQQSIAFLLISMLVLFLVAPAALAQDTGSADDDGARPAASIQMIAATDDSNGAITIVQAADTAPDVAVTVNGVPSENVTVARGNESDLDVSTVLVIDTSVLGDTAFDDFKTIANDLIASKAPGERMAIISTGSAVNVRATLTRDQGKLLQRVSQLESKGALYLWDGIDEAARLLAATPRGSVRNIVVMAATADVTSTTSAAAARGEMLSTTAIGHVLVVNRDGVDVNSLNRFGTESKGSINVVGQDALADPAALNEASASIRQAAAGSWIVGFTNAELPNGGEISVVVDGVTTNSAFIKGSLTSGPALSPIPVPEGNRFALVSGGLARTLGILLGGLAIAMGTFSVFLLFQKRESSIGSLLQPYDEDGGHSDNFDDIEESSFASNALVSKAVDFTEDFADKRGMLEIAEAKLEKANLALRPAEAMTMYFAAVALGGVIGLMLKGLLGLLLGLAVGAILPNLIVNHLGNKRRKKFNAQLPDMLQLLAGTLKAGYSFMQGVEAVSHEAESPMGDELRLVVTEAQLGKPVEEAMSAAAERMDSPDFAWAVMAVNIQREVGGNLAELLMTVSDTMTARERLAREVAALTAEGRVSALVLGAMPVLLGLAMYVINPEYIGVLFSETIGYVLIGAASTMVVIGFLWMKKLIEIRI